MKTSLLKTQYKNVLLQNTLEQRPDKINEFIEELTMWMEKKYQL